MVENKISGRWIGVIGMLAVGVLVGAGCSSGGDPPAPTTGVDTTVVRVGTDGKVHTYHYVASPEQYARELAAKKAFLKHEPLPADSTKGAAGGEAVGQQASAITKDGTCNGADLWVYDVSNCPTTGTFARLCLTGQGTENLDNDTFCLYYGGTCFTVYWSHNVYSYYPGNEDGYFENAAWGTQVSFSKYTSCANTNLCNPGGDCDSLTLTD